MTSPNLSSSEAERLLALQQYAVLDSLPEQALDDLTVLAAQICEVPIAVIALVDEQRQWFKSKVGIELDETPRDQSFCSHAVHTKDVFTVRDALLDERFANSPLVTEEPLVRFYAGAPLLTAEGYNLGTLCVIDRVPRELTKAQEQSLRVLARQVMVHLDLRRHALALAESEHTSRSIIASSLDAIITIDEDKCISDFNEAAEKMFGRTQEEVRGQKIVGLIIPERFRTSHLQTLKTGDSPILNQHAELVALSVDGTEFPVELTATRLGTSSPPKFTLFVRDITQRRQSALALLASEANLKKAQHIARLGSWEHTLITGRLVWSEETYRIFGREPSETPADYHTFLDAVHPEDRDMLIEAHRSVLLGGARLDVEHRIVLPDGTIRWVHELAELECTPDGQPVRVTGTVMDITERRISEGRYRTLFECAPDGIIISNARNDYLDGNPSICRMLGYDREEMSRLHYSDVVAPTQVGQIAPALLTVKSRSLYQREWQLRRKNGALIDAEIIGTLMPDGNILSMVRDITERKRIEARFRRLVDSNVQGVFFWNARGSIIEANNAFLKLLQYTRADLATETFRWEEITPAEFSPVDARATEELTTLGVCTPYEKEYIRKDGVRVPVLIGAAVFEDSRDEGICFVLDLSERKKLEQQFLRAQRMESIGTLAGGIAHDLNNVLAPIIMSLDLLKARFQDAESQNLLSIISTSAIRGADMVRQVLTFAKGVGGRRMEVRINHIVLDIQKIANDTFLKNIQVKSDVPDDLWTVTGDPTQLHQVLLNLCVNARDAMPTGGLLTISAQNLVLDAHYAALEIEASPGPYVFIQIEDTGSGMPPDLIEKIFDPFFTTKEIGKGTGLGLSTSLAIVKNHDGFLRVYSEMGKGTRFKLYFPAQTQTSVAPAEEETPELPRGSGELILVVDDEASVRQITQQTLEAFGYRVVLASDGAEAVATYASRRKDIAAVLTDMMMPVMDGPTTIQVLQRMNPDVAVIAASGLAANAHIAHASRMGVKHFLPKPYTAETLLKVLKDILHPQEKAHS